MLTIEKLEPIFQDFPVPALILAATDKLEIVKANEAYLNLLNCQETTIVGHPLFEVFPDEDVENPESVVKKIHRTIKQVIASKEPKTPGIISYHLPSNRREHPSLQFFFPEFIPVIDSTSSVVYIFHLTREVEGKTASEHLPLLPLTPYEDFLEISQNPFLITTSEGSVVAGNEAASQLFGYNKTELHLIRFQDVLGNTDPRLTLLLLMLDEEGKARGEVTGIRKNGECFPCEYSSVRFIDNGGAVRYCTEIKDLSKWRLVETKANQSEENLRTIFNNTTEGFILLDTNLRILAYNEKAFEFIFLNTTYESFSVGASIFDFVEDQRRKYFEEVTKRLRMGNAVEYERHYQVHEGVSKWFRFAFNPVLEENQFNGVCISGRDITAQKQSEAAVLDTAERFRRLIEHNTDAISILSAAGRVVYISPAGRQITGYNEEEVKLIYILNIIHKDDRAAAEEVMHQVYEKPGVPIEAAPIRIQHKDGSWRWIEATITNMLHDPSVGGIIDNFRDVTKRIDSEKQLVEAVEEIKRSEEKYRKIFNFCPIPIWVYDLDTLQILEVNEEAVGHYGYNKEEFLSMTILDIRPKEDAAQVKVVVQDLPSKGLRDFGYWRHLKKDGQLITVDITAHPFEYNGKNARMVISRDVTEMLKAEAKLLQSNERFIQASRATSDAIWDWNMKTNTVFLGEGYATLFGYPEAGSTVPREWMSEKIPTEDYPAVWKKINDSIDGISNQWQHEYNFRKADGSFAIIRTNAITIRDSEEKAIRMIGAMKDITAQKQEEYRLLLLESVITHATDSIMITAATPNYQGIPEIIYVNSAFERMTGYTSEEIKAGGIHLLNGPETTADEMDTLENAVRNNSSCQILNVFYKKSGEKYWASLAVAPVIDEMGEAKNYITITRDVTERVKYLRAIEEQNKQLHDIAWHQSHIIRAPLARILGLIDLLIHSKGKNDIDEILPLLQRSADDLDDVIQQIIKKTYVISKHS